jgi:septal ring factor EnvC (AmiA/AmiB activator)
MRAIAKHVLLLGLLCCLLSGCFAERRREVREKATDLQTRVAVLQQRVEAQERRLEKLEAEMAELNKHR